MAASRSSAYDFEAARARVAEHVAAGISDDAGASFSDGLSDVARLPLLNHQARANALVINLSLIHISEPTRPY